MRSNSGKPKAASVAARAIVSQALLLPGREGAETSCRGNRKQGVSSIGGKNAFEVYFNEIQGEKCSE